MKADEQRNRVLKHLLPKMNARKIVLITGARQTGKTTLVKKLYPSLPYINLDSEKNREKIRMVSAENWHRDIQQAVIDEAQKEFSVFEKIKYAYDEGTLRFSVLLGSSQILLMKQVRESLAGRVAIYELYPLMLCELFAENQSKAEIPLFDFLLNGQSIGITLKKQKQILLDPIHSHLENTLHYAFQFGGMPALLHLSPGERMEWLRDYEFTYLQRDLADLARLSDLQPFRLFQRLAALRAASLINYSELARDASISVDTAKRYLEYLRLSYQVELVQPFYQNLTSALVKTPKLYWIDIGVLRSITGYSGSMTGALFENFVVSEIIKWTRTNKKKVDIYFYRTRSGMEVDLLLQLPEGIIGIEIKSRKKVSARDTFNLRKVADELKKQWLGGMVIYMGDELMFLDAPDIWAIPVGRLFV